LMQPPRFHGHDGIRQHHPNHLQNDLNSLENTGSLPNQEVIGGLVNEHHSLTDSPTLLLTSFVCCIRPKVNGSTNAMLNIPPKKRLPARLKGGESKTA
jgi:hypothetical protein